MRQRVADLLRAVLQQADDPQRDGRERTRPHHEAECVDAPGRAPDEIAQGPGEGRADHEHDAECRHAGLRRYVRRDDRQAADGQRERGPLQGLQAIAVDHGGQPDREEHLRLDHQRREAGRDVRAHGPEQQPELADADQGAERRQLGPGHRRLRDEEDERQERERVAQRREGVGREGVEAQSDDDEVRAPDRDDREGEQQVGQGHAWSLGDAGRPAVPQALCRCSRSACSDVSSHLLHPDLQASGGRRWLFTWRRKSASVRPASSRKTSSSTSSERMRSMRKLRNAARCSHQAPRVHTASQW